MDEILALQYRRKSRRLQMLVLPYSFNISGAALIRMTSVLRTEDPLAGWRVQPIVGMAMTLKINDLPDFEADAAMRSIFETAWMKSDALRIEAKGLVSTEGWDMGDLVADRVPRALLTRVPEQVDNWA